jgi:hypothetical protein
MFQVLLLYSISYDCFFSKYVLNALYMFKLPFVRIECVSGLLENRDFVTTEWLANFLEKSAKLKTQPLQLVSFLL